MIDVALRLEVSDARRRFALDVAFASEAPVLALYGPSGAGKSLTLQAVAGLLAARSGHVRIGTRCLFDSASGIAVPAAERGVGYLFQHYALFPHLSVRENVAFGLGSWRRRPTSDQLVQVDSLLDRFGLAATANSRPGTLSGGQQQRAALARALACRPQVLLLDEPFAALSPALRRELRDELAALRREAGIPMILITHDADDLQALADEVFLLDEGRVQQTMSLASPQQRAGVRQALQEVGWA